jgi:hypothetical protein
MLGMDKLEPKPGNWRRMRWAWFALAVLGVLLTPGAILSAIDLYKTDHKLGFVIPIAFTIRFAQIWFFTWLSWKCRPLKSETNHQA